jgi:mobA/mobL protein
MASYHFELKSDKKPNGVQIKAGSHISYVNREGKFQNIDTNMELRTDVHSYRSTISGTHPILPLPKQPVLLYSSPFGKIKLDEQGIHVTKNASLETVGIALAAAQRIFGEELSLAGTEAFQESALATVRDLNLDLHFMDSELEKRNAANKKEREKLERRRGDGTREAGGRIGRNGFGDFSGRTKGRAGEVDGHSGNFLTHSPSGSISKSDTHQPTIDEIAQKGLRLHVLPGGNVGTKERRTPVFLSDDVKRQLYLRGGGRETRLALRWTHSRARRRDVERTANSILEILQKGTDSTFASSHLQYINREAAHEMRGGCVATGHQMPRWAEDSPLKFFHAADRYERANGERYKEIIFALPNELNLAQQKEILDAFLSKHLADHYYAWAIHEKVGTLSSGERQPHVHIMFSTREIDAQERQQERTPEKFFQRANKKHPDKGGCAKAEKWVGRKRKDYLLHIREDFAKIQNAVLEKYGVPVRVDHRTLKAQQEDALRRGDHVLAELLNRIPETDFAVSLDDILKKNARVERFQRLRALNDRHRHLVSAKNLTADRVRQIKAEELFENLLDEYSDLQDHLPEDVRKDLEDVHRDLLATATTVLWGDAAQEQARLSFMEEETRTLWHDMKEARAQLLDLRALAASIQTAEKTVTDEEHSAEKLLPALEERITIARKKYQRLAKKLQPEMRKLSARGTVRNIELRVNQLLFENELAKKRFEKRLRDFAEMVKTAKSNLHTDEDAQTLSLADVVRILSEAKRYTDAVIVEKRKELAAAQKDVLTSERAELIAQNIFAGGAWKELRARENSHRKQEQYYKNDVEAWKKDRSAFDKKEAPGFFASSAAKKAYKEEENALEERRSALLERKENLTKEAAELARVRSKLTERCSTPEATKKIAEIAAGVMERNKPFAAKASKLAGELAAMTKESAELGKEKSAADRQRKSEGDGARYIAAPSSGGGGARRTPLQAARTIAKGIIDPQYAALVARSKDSRMGENWMLMSEMEKDEILAESAKGR